MDEPSKPQGPTPESQAAVSLPKATRKAAPVSPQEQDLPEPRSPTVLPDHVRGASHQPHAPGNCYGEGTHTSPKDPYSAHGPRGEGIPESQGGPMEDRVWG